MKIVNRRTFLLCFMLVLLSGCITTQPTVLKPNLDKPVRIQGFEECKEADNNKEDRKCLMRQ